MTRSDTFLPPPDPRLDLVIERDLDVRPGLIWAAWTTPAHLRHWFCPRPYVISDCEVDLRPGGIFRFVIRSPEGHDMPHINCYLDIVPERRIVWTNALLPGYRPVRPNFLPHTAAFSIEPSGAGTRYTARAIHKDEAGRQKHDEMGFYEGWGTCIDQLAEYVKKQSQ